MSYCCVPFCKSNKRKDKTISMHEFPSDSTLCYKWLKNVARKDFIPNDRSATSVVCSKHFKDEDYVPNLKIRKLVKEAVPTVFYNYPAYMIPNSKKERKPLNRKRLLDTVNCHFQPSTLPSSEEAVLLENEVTGVSCDIKLRKLVKGAVPTVIYKDPTYMIPNSKTERKPLNEKHCLDAVNCDFQPSTSQSSEEAVLLENKVRGSCDQGTQTKITYLQLVKNCKMLHNSRRRLMYKNKLISKLMKKISHLTKLVDYYRTNEYFTYLEKMIVLDEKGLA